MFSFGKASLFTAALPSHGALQLPSLQEASEEAQTLAKEATSKLDLGSWQPFQWAVKHN